ncbi:hypothetical protein PAXRUDRAFT_149469 [Paxillus rubicundulus Ve08.2h10]|uniref:Unplaced genomic scaffold scaffold_564, whole genome shotgun sequence n=1 Tax=Paxillus rubicundulus Ve08.2h10 TaxID=930991 RepID=A0A0D0E3B4_9AGAM|nr:hypothetical protein PAXRUDRAFT_149469 [Paxillus rubicundulus Ve08.2h10]
MVFPAHNSPPVDLRRMTSNSTLLTPPHREHRLSTHASQHLHTGSARLGSRSPSSIPSSPTSAHSSSSAIFERDIEPIGPPSPPSSHHSNPHRIPRSKATEQLEQSVPSVLDSAASILAFASPMDEDHIAVLTPARERDRQFKSGFASPIGSLRSRSPSPISTKSPMGHRTSLLLSVPGSSSPPAPMSDPLLSTSPIKDKDAQARLIIQTSPAVIYPAAGTAAVAKKLGRSSPSINTPTSAYYSTLSSAGSSPNTTVVELPPHPLPISPSSTYTGSPYSHPLNLSHPPSPTHGASKRLSFMSYSDLLASTPASMVPLSSFTTCASSEPPPHIPGVTGFGNVHLSGGSIHGRERDSIAVLDDVGGEWEREGMGRGLEERLEALMTVPGSA